MCADKRSPQALPSGIHLEYSLTGHNGHVHRLAISPNREILASASLDNTVRLWDLATRKLVRTLSGSDQPSAQVFGVAWSKNGKRLAFGGTDKSVKICDLTGKLLQTLDCDDNVISVCWSPRSNTILAGIAGDAVQVFNADTGESLESLKGHTSTVVAIALSPDKQILSTASADKTVRLWNHDTGETIRVLRGHSDRVNDVAWSPDGKVLVSGSSDSTIRIWNPQTGRIRRILEGHTDQVSSVLFSDDGRILISKATDGTLRLWNCANWQTVAVIDDLERGCLATGICLGDDSSTLVAQSSRGALKVFKLDVDLTVKKTDLNARHYINAKVVLLGDTGVGKSGLSLVLNGKPFAPTDSTPGRRVWTLQSRKVRRKGNVEQTRETLLWDLAGQPGYRVIHQLHLNEVAVALVVFDARSEIDPLAGVRHWERALRLAQQRQGAASIPMKKFLVSARADRGTVSVSKERIDALLTDFGFEQYFETSAKEGWQIKDLQNAITQGISWDSLPEVSSSDLFSEIKNFLLRIKKSGRLIAPKSELFEEFVDLYPDLAMKETNLEAQFDTCIGRLENRDLIRRLSFGGYVLLQPELLDAYASAMVNAAKEEPDGLGSIAEDVCLAGQFFIPKEQKIDERSQEQLLLHATLEELMRHDLALKQRASDGSYLVFPSQFNRDYEDAPEPKGKALAMTFEGPAQSLYATLAVRLGHSGLFNTGRTEMWRNAAVFAAKAGGKCGLYLQEFAEARGRLLIFYDQHLGRLPSDETRFHFEEFVVDHAKSHAIDGTLDLVRFFVCLNCGDPLPDSYVKRLSERGLKKFACPCGRNVSLEQPKDRLLYESKVKEMADSADKQRNIEMFVESARGETKTPSFMEWAGGERVTLAIVFTDIVGSTGLGEELKDMVMNEVRRLHFAQSRKLIQSYKGREIKTIGDSFMAAFRSVENALDYASALQTEPGHEQVRLRAGIHIGPMQVEDDDVFGGAVNFAARVVSVIKGAEIWLSDRAKEDLDRGGAKHHRQLSWQRHDEVEMKGFSGVFTLWALNLNSA